MKGKRLTKKVSEVFNRNKTSEAPIKVKMLATKAVSKFIRDTEKARKIAKSHSIQFD